MATLPSDIPAGLPAQEDTASSLNGPEGLRAAREIVERHRTGKEKRRIRDLTAEKYLIHVDAEGDGQWADIFNGSVVRVPPKPGGSLRLQANLLRPMVQNFISYNTSLPFRALAVAGSDRKAKDRARIDTAFANHLIRAQRFNELFAEALGIAAVYGHCPVHAAWRSDLRYDPYEPIYNTGMEGADAMRPGMLDCWVGDPWSTVYNDGATRRSVHWFSYERILPATLVRQAFPDAELEGSTDLAAASRYQRTARKWTAAGGGVHGTGAMDGGRDNDEMIALVCREIAPGVDSRYPDGWLEIAALQGASSTDQTETAGGAGRGVLLWQGPLPGKRFSATRVYALDLWDDVFGKAYVADLDKLQTEYNQLRTLRAEYIRRYSRPQMVVQTGMLEQDAQITGDDAIIEYAGGNPPYLLTPPQGDSGVQAQIADCLDQMFRIGGWQAASRGESNAGDAAAKVVALAKADDSIFGPINRQLRGSVCEFLQTCHQLARQYMTVPMLVSDLGDEYGHLADAYLRREDLSDEAPTYELISGSGATPESQIQQLMGLVTTPASDGSPLMTVGEFWDRFPDATVRPPTNDVAQVRKRRAQQINYAILKAADEMAAQMEGQQMPPEWQQHAATMLFQQLHQQFPPKQTDPPQLHIDTLDEIVQDEMAAPLARQVAEQRQAVYLQWIAQIQMAGAGAPPQGGAPGQPQQAQPQPTSTGAAEIGGTPTSDAMNPSNLAGQVDSLTQQAANA